MVYGINAYDTELKCLNATKEWQYKGKELLMNKGKTEMRTKNVIDEILPLIQKEEANAVV